MQTRIKKDILKKISVRESGSLSKLSLSAPAQQTQPQPPPYDNMLANVKPDEVYQAVAGDILTQALSYLQQKDEEIAKKLLSRRDVSEPIAGDTFYSMYSFHPMLKEKDSIKNELLQEFVDVFKKWMSTKEYTSIRTITRLNRTASTVFALRFAKEFLYELAQRIPPEDFPPNPPPGGRACPPGTICDYGQGGGGETGAQQPQPQPGQGRGGQGQQQGQNNNNSNNGNNQGNQGNQPGQGQGSGQQPQIDREKLKQAVKEAFEKAKEKGKEAVETYSTMGSLTQGFTPAKLAFLDEELGIDHVEFRTIIEILGKLKKAMPIMFSQHKVRARIGMPEGYGITRKPEKALPRELATPEELFLAKLVKGQFLTKEKKTREKGVMVLLLDRSGSMGGEKMAWAKAVALALAVKAVKEKLDYVLIPFDDIPHEPMTLEQVEDILKIISGGGTDIGKAIITGLELALENNYKRANIIVITDGADAVINKYEEKILELAKKASANIKVFYIQGTNDVLKRLARATRGQLLTVEPSGESAIKVVMSA